METLKKILSYILAGLGLLFTIIKIKQKIEKNNFTKENEKLKKEQQELQATADAEKSNMEKLKEEHEASKSKQLTPEEVENYWKNRK